MIDIHSHVLPEVDDGSRAFALSLGMLQTARAQGVTHIILTPHFRKPFLESKQSLKKIFDEFCQQVKNQGLDVELFLGQEIRFNKRVPSMLDAGELITLNDGKYILVEFSLLKRTDSEDIVDVVYGLKKQGYIPIVAHLERYSYVDMDVACQIKNVGGLIQINAGSLVNENGFAVKRKATVFLKNGLVDFVASDIHENRKYSMGKAFKKISKKFGEEVANDLFINNAKKIIEG